MSAFEPYNYETCRLTSTSSIRLATLRSRNFSEEITCELQAIEIDAASPYVAVSYVWGSVEDLATIDVFDTSCIGSLEVPRNLLAFLKRMQAPKKSTRFWIDSICINQSNTEERNEQVKKMGRIYRSACSVAIWLGEPQSDVELDNAIECMKTINRSKSKWQPLLDELYATSGHYPKFSDSFDSIVSISRPGADETHRMAGLPLLDSPEFVAMEALFNHEWCTRAWTWQESWVAKRRVFFSGKWSWTDNLVKCALLAIKKLNLLNRNGRYLKTVSKMQVMISGLDTWTKTEATSRHYLDLFEILQVRRGSQCTYPSDVLYSLLGASQNCSDIEVDYRIPFEETFAKATFQFILQTGLEVLATGEDRAETSSLPSWVPDWRNKESSRGISDGRFGHVRYRASGTSKISVSLSTDARELHVSGITFDRISMSRNIGALDPKWEEDMSRRVELDSAGGKIYNFTGESLEKSLKRVHWLDRTSFTMAEESRWLPDSHEIFESTVASAGSGTNDDRMRYGFLLWSAIEMHTYRSRASFITEEGRLGASSGNVRCGDIVVVLFGGEVLYALRPCPGSSYYQYVSECYVHGFMDGEALVAIRKKLQPDYDTEDRAWLDHLDSESLPFPVETFHIR